MAHNETFVTWLNNAYALEIQLIEVLEAHRGQAEGYPDVQEKISEHIEVTREHAEKVSECLSGLGEEPSGVKGALGGMMGSLAGAASSLPGDRVIKNGIADYAAENFEKATYNALIVAAEELEHPEIAKVCKEILADEEEMADWLENNLPKAVQTYLEEQRAADLKDES